MRPAIVARAEELAAAEGGKVLVTDDIDEGVQGVDFIYTDVWLSMGSRRRSGTRASRCCRGLRRDHRDDGQDGEGDQVPPLPAGLPRHQDRRRQDIAEDRAAVPRGQRRGLPSPASIVFDQAENRMHTIKAVMVATLGR